VTVELVFSDLDRQ